MTAKEDRRGPPHQYANSTWSNSDKIIQHPNGDIEIRRLIDGDSSLLIFHGSGSYIEYRGATGSVVQFAANNHMFYQKGGLTISVDNNGDVKMAGHSRINIDTDAHIEVAKDASIVVNGQAEIVGRGHVKFAAADIELATTQGSIVLNAARDIELRADKGRILQHSSGVNQLTTDSGDFHIEVAGDIVAKAQNINRIAQKDITESAQGNIIESAQSNITSDCGGTNTVSGASIVTASDGGTKLEGGGIPLPPSTVSPSGRKQTSAPTS